MGNTFLAPWVVAAANSKTRAAFCSPFPATMMSIYTTAVSIIHTLLFQLTSEDVDIQSILTESSKIDLKSNLAAAQELLTTALECANKVSTVIDGLDEVEPLELELLWTALIKDLHDCSDVVLKMCISSRAEDDITEILVPKAAALCVYRINALDIEAYDKSRFEEWMAGTDFLADGKSEIEALLSPISTKAKGQCDGF